MENDLSNMLSGQRAKDCHLAVSRGDPKDATLHLKKLNVFGQTARDSLCKHFDRWIKAPLLPAGLLAEAPAANVVAATIRKEEPTHGTLEDKKTGKMPCFSQVHKQIVDLRKFRIFLKR